MVRLISPKPAPVKRRGTASHVNKLAPEDRPAHDWYRFVPSYPPHLVRDYIDRFEVSSRSTVLDPFCGTGTTMVECKKQGIPSYRAADHLAEERIAAVGKVKQTWVGGQAERR